MATRVLLLRHAQSEWNAEGRWQGWADPPLSDDGRREAEAAAASPALDGVERAVASDLERARQTAAIIAGRRGWPSVQTFRGLRERGAGDWTGLTRLQIEETWPGALHAPVLVIPGGEGTAAVTARGVATLHRIAERWPGGSVLAVCHGALIGLVERHVSGESVRVPNLGGRWVEVAGGRLTLGDPVTLAEAAPAVEQAG